MTYSPAYYATLTRLLGKMRGIMPDITSGKLSATLGALLFNFGGDYTKIEASLDAMREVKP